MLDIKCTCKTIILNKFSSTFQQTFIVFLFVTTGFTRDTRKSKGRIKEGPSFKCNACTNNIKISQDDPEVIIRNDKFEVVDSFCYLGDSISQSGSCFEATTDRVRADWKNFHS